MRLYHSSAFDFSTAVDSHWEASAPPLGREPGVLEDSKSHDVAIVGAGFTGLNCALRLARDYGLNVAVLDAAWPGWGASGRNGGFCCMGAAKLGVGAMIKKFGMPAVQEFHSVQRVAIDHVGGLLEQYDIDADRSEGGELQLAHTASRVQELKDEQAFMEETFGIKSRFLDPSDLEAEGTRSEEFHAGLTSSLGFGLHPLKYLRGLARAAIDAGVTVYAHSPVTSWREEAGRNVLVSPKGQVTAKSVLFATNGYTDEKLPEWIGGRILPALSRILVTRPMSDNELKAQGWTRTIPSYDTRKLLHYFRLLPDNRMMFGGRGGTSADPSSLDSIYQQLRGDFERIFPAWAHVETERHWSGLVCLASGLIPYAGPVGDARNAWMSLAYHGNGVAMGSYSGALMADVVSGEKPLEKVIPEIQRQPLDKFPLPALRLASLKAAYVYYAAKDRWF